MYRTVQQTCLILLLLTLIVSGYSIAQTTEDGMTQSSDDSIGRLADAVEKLTRQLENQAFEDKMDSELRKLDIAISYLNFRSRRIETIERDLGIIRNEHSRVEDALNNWQERREMLAREMETKTGDEKEALLRDINDMEAREKIFTQRMARHEEEIIVLENRIAELQSELDSVESYVQEHLKM